MLRPGEPDQILMEPTSGNTGIGLAMVCRVKGYHLKAVMPTNVSVERRQLLELWGAEIIESPGSEGSNGAVRMARGLAEDHPEWVFLYQYANPANPRAHYEGTGPEILRDCPDITHFVAGLGTSGTLLGVGRFLREKLGDAVSIWAVEPPAGEMVDGLRNLDDGYIPPIFEDLGGAELSNRKTVVRPRESIEWTRRLTEVGIFAGISTGAALAGAVKCAASLGRGRVGLDRGGLGRRRLEVPFDGRLDRRPRRSHRAGQGNHLLLTAAAAPSRPDVTPVSASSHDLTGVFAHVGPMELPQATSNSGRHCHGEGCGPQRVRPLTWQGPQNENPTQPSPHRRARFGWRSSRRGRPWD